MELQEWLVGVRRLYDECSGGVIETQDDEDRLHVECAAWALEYGPALIAKCEELAGKVRDAVVWLREDSDSRYPKAAALADELEAGLNAPGRGGE